MEREVLGVGSTPAAILTYCQNMKTNGLELHKQEYSWVVKMRNISEVVLRQYHGPTSIGQYNGLGEYCSPHTASSVFLI